MRSRSPFNPEQTGRDCPGAGPGKNNLRPGKLVSGLGTIVHDEQLFVSQYPGRDTKSVALNHRRQIGGPVPTALAQLAKLGHSTRFLGSWGDDSAGQAIETDLRETRIQFDPIACRSSPETGFAHIWVERATGSRTVVATPPTGTPSTANAAMFGQSATLLHLDGWGGDAAIAAADAAVGIVTFDCGSIKPTTRRLLELANVVNAPLHFIREYCGTHDAARGAVQLLDLGPRIVTITNGEEGAGIWTRNFSIWLAAPEVPVVDTCGAGDVFCGGLLDGILRNLEPLDLLKNAMAAATWKVSHAGNREALANREQLDSFLAKISGSAA